MKKMALIIVMVLFIGAFFTFDLQHALTLQGLKESLAQFQVWRAADPLLIGAGFFLLYVLVAALSLPGAVIMTLAAGALFGLLWGSIIVSFASSLGASLAFLVSRHVLRDSVQSRFGERLQYINAGIEKEGAFYLFMLRLVPIFPFFLVT